MRLTRIYLRQYNRVGMIAAALILGIALQHFWNITDPSRFSKYTDIVKTQGLTEQYSGYSISAYSNFPNTGESYSISNGKLTLTSKELIQSGVHVYSVNACELKLVKGDDSLNLKCGS